ncbi:response regulator transcription factor [Zhongshania marina]|jgi:two-component system OmpR family response regulator|uniref:DNA-binding response regulator n=1 Tax=Zhongshania marina TaxID=2304603 RepID=A0A2S4HBG8_9GAMM|nr:response regulator transcription factor [Marortus luteolus]POP51323.1 DNA-binding response regulator [Marortus luteolus]RNL58001.1 DNA-binding response regulator [Zhongshania marina]
MVIDARLCILVVDDNEDILQLVSELLTAEGYQSLSAANGEEMYAALTQQRPDLILLDVMLPGRDGFELCRQLRADPESPPVIMLSAKDQEIDRVVGLELGADDYIVKPFGRRELIARIKAVLRRSGNTEGRRAQGVYCFDGWRFKPARMELIDSNSTVIPLSTSESDLLLVFVQNPQIPMSRDRLLAMTKGRNSAAFDRSIDSHISRLRRKLGDSAKAPEIIKTAWGAGYQFTCAVDLI